MRYLVGVDNLFPDGPSGSARVAWDIAIAMRNLGHDVTIAAARHHKNVPPGIECVEGMRVVRYEKSQVHTLDPRRHMKVIHDAAKQLKEHLSGEVFDTLHLHVPLTGSAVLQAFPKTPRVVYTMHSPVLMEMHIVWGQQGLIGKLKQFVAKGALRRMEADLLKRADAIHTLSSFTKRYIDNDYRLAHKVSVIPHWCREGERRSLLKQQARRELGWPEDQKILFTVRRHVYRMGIDVAIKAVAPLATKGICRFYIGGGGELRPELERQAIRLGAQRDDICFLGKLSERDLALAYQAADLFLLPTRALECFGLIVIEAMGYGCPVLGTSAGAIPELIEPISPHMLVPPEDTASMNRVLSEWLKGNVNVPDEDKLREYVDKYYSTNTIIPRFESLLDSTLAQPIPQ